jgi:hypothetical protein
MTAHCRVHDTPSHEICVRCGVFLCANCIIVRGMCGPCSERAPEKRRDPIVIASFVSFGFGVVMFAVAALLNARPMLGVPCCVHPIGCAMALIGLMRDRSRFAAAGALVLNGLPMVGYVALGLG